VTTQTDTKAADARIGRIVARALAGILLGSAVAWAFVPAETAQGVVAFVIPLVAAAAGWYGGREIGATTAVSGALWFGFAHTEPRFHFQIDSRADVILTLSVLIVGILASELAHARHRLRRQDSTSSDR
jgi:K+-sensing histidine kinase KdpD